MDKVELARDIEEDFERRRTERREYELKWLLNMNFLTGNQYYGITPRGEVEKQPKNYSWESREVFNHIAPIVETRLSKLSKLKPLMSVRSASSADDDIETAKLSSKILNGVINSIDMQEIISEATKWSEICGTAFYKVLWDAAKGETIATDGKQPIKCGDVAALAVSPFEIYPDSPSVERLEDQKSVIHAKAFPVDEIRDRWGIDLPGKDINVNTLGILGETASSVQNVLHDAENVIERYVKPTKNRPNGRLTIVIGGSVVFDGDLPFANGTDGARIYPFIKQISLSVPGQFWGASVIDRLIPIQRAYNAVKNRKYEYMSRISMGVLKVEDGSVDTDSLAEDGLTPGKILVYRQGANPPAVMENLTVPYDFTREEEKLLDEFVLVSGVSELMRGGKYYSENASGVALQILMEIEDTKLLVSLDSIKRAVKEMAKHILRLYKQFAEIPKLVKISGGTGKIEVFSFTKNDIGGDDVVFDAENDVGTSLSQRRSMVFDLLKSGLMTDATGKMSERMRCKALEILGFGTWENMQDISDVHILKAQNENIEKHMPDPLEIDNHELHIQEHIKYALTEGMNGRKDTEKILEHIKLHRQMQRRASEIETAAAEGRSLEETGTHVQR